MNILIGKGQLTIFAHNKSFIVINNPFWKGHSFVHSFPSHHPSILPSTSPTFTRNEIFHGGLCFFGWIGYFSFAPLPRKWNVESFNLISVVVVCFSCCGFRCYWCHCNCHCHNRHSAAKETEMDIKRCNYISLAGKRDI